jgi:hypothetical protein
MRFKPPRAAYTRCSLTRPSGRGTDPGAAAASVLAAGLDECGSWLSFVDGTAREDASNSNPRKSGCLIPSWCEKYSPLPRQPCRRRVKCRDFGGTQRDQMGDPEPASNPCNAIAFQFVDRRCLRPPHDVQRRCAAARTARAADFNRECQTENGAGNSAVPVHLRVVEKSGMRVMAAQSAVGRCRIVNSI